LDNSSCETVKDTVEFKAMLRLRSRFTPMRRGESNGMVEAFAKAFKWGNANIHERHNAGAVLNNIFCWCDDYNERHMPKNCG